MSRHHLCSFALTATIAAGAALSVFFLQFADSYQLPVLRAPRMGLGKLLGAWTLAFAVMAMALFFMKVGGTYSRVWFAGWFFSGATYLVAERYFLAWALKRWLRNGILERRAVIVATSNTHRSSWFWSSSRPRRNVTRLPSGASFSARGLGPLRSGSL